MKRILTLILIATLILTAALFSPCCAQGETNESETNHTSDALFANKLTWHRDIDGARGAVVEGTIAYIASRASAETIRGASVSYRSDTGNVELRSYPAPAAYLTSDNKQCRNVTVTILVGNKVVDSFGRETCVKLDDLLPPVKKADQ